MQNWKGRFVVDSVPAGRKPVALSSDFKLVLVTGSLLTVLFLAVAGAFAVFVPAPSPMQIRVIEACLDLSKFGAGAIFGLLGGRSTKR